MEITNNIGFQVLDYNKSIVFPDTQNVTIPTYKKFISFSVISNTPYRVVTFFDLNVIHRDIVRYLSTIVGINALVFVFTYFAINYVKRRMVQIAKRADIANETLKRMIQDYVLNNADKISNPGQALLDIADEQTSYNEKIFYLASIINATDNIRYPSPHIDNYYYLDLNQLLHDLVDALGNKLVEKNINLQMLLNKDPQYAKIDGLCIRLLIAGLFLYIGDKLRLNGRLTVKTTNEVYLDKRHIKIEIIADGIELDLKVLNHIKYNDFPSGQQDQTRDSLWYIFKLAEAMQCFCAVVPIHQTMFNIKILVPQDSSEGLYQNSQDKDKSLNIVNLDVWKRNRNNL